MPQLANDILDEYVLNSPAQLYAALCTKGDSPKITIAGSGGLGSVFLQDVSLEAFLIDKQRKLVSNVARSVPHLWRLCEILQEGNPKKHIRKNSNKEIICLAFLIKQETLNLDIAHFQSLAYQRLLYYYQNMTGYNTQLLQPSTQNAMTVLKKIKKLKEEFESIKTRLELQQQHSHTIEPLYYSQPGGSRATYPEGQYYQPTQIRTSISDPSNITHQRSSTSYVQQQLYDYPLQEEKPETKEEAKQVVDALLNQMVAHSTPKNPAELTLREIKTFQKVFLIVDKIPNLSLMQLRVLSYMLSTALTKAPDRETRFDTMREETGFFFRLFRRTHGNTKTFEAVANKVQSVMLQKLTMKEFPKKYPEDDLDQFDLSRITNPVHRIPLEPTDFSNFMGLFQPMFGRWSGIPAVLDQFKNRFIPGSPHHPYKRRL